MQQTTIRQRATEKEREYQSQLQEFNDFLIKLGLASDKRIVDPVKRERRRITVIRENNFHNTSKLLKNYRKIAWSVKTAPYDIADLLGQEFEDVDKLLKALDLSDDIRAEKGEYVIDLLKDHRRMIRALHVAVAKLMIYPDHGEELYKLIVEKYMRDEKIDNFEEYFCTKNNISKATYNRLHRLATRLISQELWSVPSNEYEMFLRVLALCENDV